MAQVTKKSASKATTKAPAKKAPAKGAAAKGVTSGAKVGKVTPPAGPVQPAKGAETKAPAKGANKPAEKAPAKPRGADRPYTLASKENPFREGTVRAELFNHIKASKTTGAARALDSRITTSFMDELADREFIKYSDVK